MTQSTNEEWRPVPGYEGYYEVSDRGRVRVLDRWVLNRWGTYTRKRGHLLKVRPNGRVYACGKQRLSVQLTGADGKIYNTFVHRLVAAAFVGPAPEGTLVLHADDDPTHNTPGNLRYGTYKENVADSIKNGTRYGLNVTSCQYGHALDAPNLVKKQVGRACLACARARAYTCRRPELKPLKESMADAYYRAIMGGVKFNVKVWSEQEVARCGRGGQGLAA